MSEQHGPLWLLHRLKVEEEPLFRFSSRLTLALAILGDAEPDPVPVADLQRRFGCAAAEASRVLARMRSLGLAERDEQQPHAYRIGPAGRETRERIAALLAGAPPVTTTQENHP
jgi:hypothetical protein